MTPMIIQIQILVLMRSDAFKKPWSSVVETKDWSVRLAVCTATVFFEVKFSTKAYHVRCGQGVSTSQKEASMLKLSVSRKIENISVPGQPHGPGL